MNVLDVLRDLMLGGRHSRRTVARFGVSLPTADRWLKALRVVPGVRSVRVGQVTWFEWVPIGPAEKRQDGGAVTSLSTSARRKVAPCHPAARAAYPKPRV